MVRIHFNPILDFNVSVTKCLQLFCLPFSLLVCLSVPVCLSVVMEVIDSRQVACKLYKGLSDALICTDEFITKVVQR